MPPMLQNLCVSPIPQIVIQNRVDEEEVLEFEVNRWLDVAEDDGDVVRELPAEWPDDEPLPGEGEVLIGKCAHFRGRLQANN